MIQDYAGLSSDYSRFTGWRRNLTDCERMLEDAFANGEVSTGEFPVIAKSRHTGLFAVFTR